MKDPLSISAAISISGDENPEFTYDYERSRSPKFSRVTLAKH